MKSLTYIKNIDKFKDSNGNLYHYNQLIKNGYSKQKLKDIKKVPSELLSSKYSNYIKGMDVKVFDFDGTLSNSPTKDLGIEEWSNYYKKEYPYKGWWGRAESLDLNVFDIQPVNFMVEVYQKNTNNTKFVLTGRLNKHIPLVKKVLDKFNMNFDGYFGNNGGNTLEFKLRELKNIIKLGARTIEMWDDRVEHFPHFVKLAQDSNIPFTIHLVNNHKIIKTSCNKS